MVVGGEIEEDSSRNLLQRFGGNHGSDSAPEVAGGGGNKCEIELSLGLSLNGCFGVEPRDAKLVRSSSISSLSIFPAEHNVPLMRTCSLPTETEDERRKRKEMEGLKRMEAKRKRSEKKAAKDRRDENFDEDLNNLNHNNNNNNKSSQVFSGKMNVVAVNGETGGWMVGKGVNDGRPDSQGSIGSRGSSSSSASDFQSKPMQGLGNCAEVKSPPTVMPSASSPAGQKSPTGNQTGEGDDEPGLKKGCTTNGVRESGRSAMEEMPCVSTKGDGPNGRRVEGFLYRYRKGEEVRIVCVCHGKFLTPAEFVRHAGGGDVAHPLRHIVVSPAPSALL